MKIILTILLLTSVAFAQNNVGTLVTAPVRPQASNDTYPSAIANEVKGGPFTAANLAGLSNIPAPRLEVGAIGYAADTGLYHRLTSTSPVTWSALNGTNITNIPVSSVSGALATNGNAASLTNFPALLLRTNGSAAGLTNFPASLLTTNGNAAGLTHLNASNIVGTIPASNISSVTISNLSGTLGVVSGGTGATNAASARTNLGLGWSALTNASSANALLGYNTTNGVVVAGENPVLFADDVRFGEDLQIASSGGIYWSGALRYEPESQTFFGPLSFDSPLTASNTRNNLGLGALWLTNNNVTNFRTAIGLGSTADVSFNSVTISGGDNVALTGFGVSGGSFSGELDFEGNDLTTGGDGDWDFEGSGVSNAGTISFLAATNAINTRANLGLGATWLTNTNAVNFRAAVGLGGTNDVSFNRLTVSNGTATNTAVQIGANSGLFYASGPNRLFLSVDGSSLVFVTTNSISAPTFLGNLSGGVSVSAGSFISFAGGANVAFTRTNFGLGAAWLTNTDVTNFRTDIGLGWSALTNTNAINFREAAAMRIVQNITNIVSSGTNNVTNGFEVVVYSIAPTVGGITNTLALPSSSATAQGDRVVVIHSGPTNSVTAIRNSGAATNLATLNQPDSSLSFIYRNTAWSLVDRVLTTGSTSTAPTNTTNVVAWFEIRIGTNSYRTPLYQ